MAMKKLSQKMAKGLLMSMILMVVVIAATAATLSVMRIGCVKESVHHALLGVGIVDHRGRVSRRVVGREQDGRCIVFEQVF